MDTSFTSNRGFSEQLRRNVAYRRTKLLRVQMAKAAVGEIEGDFHVRVLGYPSGVGRPYAVHEARGPGRREPHLVDPNLARKKKHSIFRERNFAPLYQMRSFR